VAGVRGAGAVRAAADAARHGDEDS